jgi:hypothetical protein
MHPDKLITNFFTRENMFFLDDIQLDDEMVSFLSNMFFNMICSIVNNTPSRNEGINSQNVLEGAKRTFAKTSIMSLYILINFGQTFYIKDRNSPVEVEIVRNAIREHCSPVSIDYNVLSDFVSLIKIVMRLSSMQYALHRAQYQIKRKCGDEYCINYAVYNYTLGQPPILCQEHKRTGMIPVLFVTYRKFIEEMEFEDRGTKILLNIFGGTNFNVRIPNGDEGTLETIRVGKELYEIMKDEALLAGFKKTNSRVLPPKLQLDKIPEAERVSKFQGKTMSKVKKILNKSSSVKRYERPTRKERSVKKSTKKSPKKKRSVKKSVKKSPKKKRSVKKSTKKSPKKKRSVKKSTKKSPKKKRSVKKSTKKKRSVKKK